MVKIILNIITSYGDKITLLFTLFFSEQALFYNTMTNISF